MPGSLGSREGESMRVHHLARQRFAHPYVALDAAIRRIRNRSRVVVLSTGVASGAEIRRPHGSET